MNRYLWWAILLTSFTAHSQNFSCYARLDSSQLTIGNLLAEYTYEWNAGHLKLKRLFDKRSNQLIETTTPQPDLHLPGLTEKATFKSWSSNVVEDNIRVAHLQVRIHFSIDSLLVERVLRIYPQSTLVSSYFKMQGIWHGSSTTTAASRELLETTKAPTVLLPPAIGFIPLVDKHWKLRVVEFQDATDHHNTLVQEDLHWLYRTPLRLRGNVLLATPETGTAGIVVLKESPLGTSQHADVGFDFETSPQGIRIMNAGVKPTDITATDFLRTYGFAMGITTTNERDQLLALRKYQQASKKFIPARDNMIVANTWGDRGQDSRMNETFILNEIKNAARLGITHVQLDDGWQAGLSKNSASKKGMLWDDWKSESWQPHPERFPQGLDSIVAFARNENIELGLWFNPSKANSYALWQRDADILIDLFKRYKIRVFKIDGIELYDKACETNLRLFFDRVLTATAWQVVFNLDVTAGNRFGYFFGNEYGNIFLENRYTDWGNYYPHTTLRNLWMLSKNIAPENLQIEFLNVWRNEKKYTNHDVYRPVLHGLDYAIATTLMAQPLAWMELANLPEAGYASRELLDSYKTVWDKLHQGVILPIGNVPDGKSWTGFQSIGDKEGYLLIFRENNSQSTAQLLAWLTPGQKILLTPLHPKAKNKRQKVSPEGKLKFTLPEPRSFVLYHYSEVD